MLDYALALLMFVFTIFAILILLAVAIGCVIDLWYWWRLPKQLRFLQKPIPFPPVDDKVLRTLIFLKEKALLSSSLEQGTFISEYVNAIDNVLVERSRESLLRLHAVRIILRDKAIKISRV
jgi:hypothetical protein